MDRSGYADDGDATPAGPDPSDMEGRAPPAGSGASGPPTPSSLPETDPAVEAAPTPPEPGEPPATPPGTAAPPPTSGAPALDAAPLPEPLPAKCSTLPARLVVFQPDGGVEIALDPLRVEASTGRLGEWHAQEELFGVSQSLRGAYQSRLRAVLARWRAAFARHKAAVLVVLVLDVSYLITLLVISSTWDASRAPLTGAAKFFVGAEPRDDNSVTFIVAALLTDALAAVGTLREVSGVMTLFLVWSLVLLIFGVLQLPGFFVTLRVLLLLAGFQFRFSLAAMRNFIEPTNLLLALCTAAYGGLRTAARFLAAPFRACCLRARAAPPQALPETGEGEQAQQAQHVQQMQEQAEAGPLPAGTPGSSQSLASLAAGDLERGDASPASALARPQSARSQPASPPTPAGTSASAAGRSRRGSGRSSSGVGTPARDREPEPGMPLDDFATLVMLQLASFTSRQRSSSGGAQAPGSGGDEGALMPMITVEAPPPLVM